MSRNGRGFSLALSLIILLVMGILYYFSRFTQSDKLYSPMSMYSQDVESDVDPKEVYMQQLGVNILAAVKCHTEMTLGTNVNVYNGSAWFKDEDVALTKEYLEDKLSTDESVISGVFEKGDNILAVQTIKFTNSNTSSLNSDGDMFIEVTVGTKYKIVFDKVLTWWCHIGKDNYDKHTEVIGNTGSYNTCTQGYIIGQARKKTTATLYKKNNLDEWEPYSWLEYYNLK